MVFTHIPGDRLRRKRILADDMALQTGIGLQRCAQREMRGESVVDIGHAARRRIIGDALGWTDAADAAAIDLDIRDAPVVNQLPCHMEIVRGFAAGNADLSATRGERRIGVVGAAEEWFLQPGGADLLEYADASGRGIDILAPDLTSID